MMLRQTEPTRSRSLLRLVEGGRAKAAVILPSGASPALRAAAEDLVRIVKRMSGARLPLLSEASRARAPVRIRLGPSQASSLGVSLDGVGPEGYRLARVGNDLLIAGVTDGGTAHGIYSVLQDCLGVRWLMPGDLWEIVPERRTVSIRTQDRVVNPSFLYRVYSGATDARWRARNRLSCDPKHLPFYGHGHNLKNIITASRYGREHPEYFAEIAGKRFVPESDSQESSQPCFTNPDVIRITVEAARAFFDSHPERASFPLCANDNSEYCTCPGCSALDSPPRVWRSEPAHSDSHFYFVSQVAKEVAKSHPDRYLICYAYWGTDAIPRKIRKLPENVAIMLTQDTSQHFDPSYRETDRAILRRWTRSAEHVAKYDYYGLGWLTPRYFPTVAADDVRFCHEQRTAGIYNEVFPYWAITGPMVWLGAQLMWDAKADPDALLDSFMLSAFGRAAAYLKAFYKTLERIWCHPRKGMWFQGLEKMRHETAAVNPAAMKQAWRLLQQAEERASGGAAPRGHPEGAPSGASERAAPRGHPERAPSGARERAAARVAYIRNGFEMSYLLAVIYDEARRLAERTIRREADIRAVLDRSRKVLARLDEPLQAFRQHIEGDPAYSHTYFRPRRFPEKIETWREEIAELLAMALTRALLWAKGRLHPREVQAFQEKMAPLTDELRSVSSSPV
jgi:hypothetical protein